LFDHQPEDQQRPRKKKRVWRKVLVALLVIVILGVLGIGLYVWNVGRSFDKNANRLSDEQVFGDQNAGGKEGDGTNILLLGSDEPMDEVDVNNSRGLRSDTIMVMHLSEDGGNVQIMSIPRDTRGDVEGRGTPKVKSALYDGGPPVAVSATTDVLRTDLHHRGNIASPLSYVGLPLAVSTVSDFIGTGLDHVSILDFEGFKALTDSLGGVTVNSEQAFEKNGYTFTKGENVLDGDEALTFVRERKQ